MPGQVQLKRFRPEAQNVTARKQFFQGGVEIDPPDVATPAVVTNLPASYNTDVYQVNQGGVVLATISVASNGIVTLGLNPNNSNGVLVNIATGRAKMGYDTTGAYIDSANKTVQVRSAGAAGLQVTTAQSALVGKGAVATTATDGFAYLPVVAGAPTGVPTAQTGFAPAVIDSTNNKIWVYLGGAWKGVTVA